ncbi:MULTISPECIES: SH3 domain-containing protein [unclassified Pseudonocardia]|jgi:uncharacterized protein YraI|uniref:SH3 domain-containing protein n=1 Tax=unclassified Pseudonocardia TaxID=2619320 RepID=UPI001ACC168D|nr:MULTISPECIES: SH3 domain-containing protein [unclassified Pseudonocardia]MBN9102596.1 SH3 domain-containing protein [Pseudonocardia sp.]
MNPRLTMRRHGRAIAVVGALVAVSATTTMALVAGTAAAAPSATQPGKCVDNVNVRAQPSTTSKIVAVCEAGKAVQVDETRDGFVHLVDLKGWAAQEYVSVNGKTPPTPASRATPATTTKPDSAATPAQRARTTPGTSGNQVGPTRSGSAGDVTPAPDASGPSAQRVDDQGDGSRDQGSGDQGSTDQGGSPSGLGGLFG